jgi:hypothetical protein
MDWTRSDTIGLAAAQCASCRGLGLKGGHATSTQPCNCVLRAIFRACFARFRSIVAGGGSMTRVSLEANPGRERKTVWGRKDEEFAADFILVSERFLDEFEYKIYRYHFLLGADWRLCCRRLGVDRGTFFHAVYRIQQRLGRAFRELQPYGLYPLEDYFHATGARSQALPGQVDRVIPIRPPLAPREKQPPTRRAA